MKINILNAKCSNSFIKNSIYFFYFLVIFGRNTAIEASTLSNSGKAIIEKVNAFAQCFFPKKKKASGLWMAYSEGFEVLNSKFTELNASSNLKHGIEKKYSCKEILEEFLKLEPSNFQNLGFDEKDSDRVSKRENFLKKFVFLASNLFPRILYYKIRKKTKSNKTKLKKAKSLIYEIAELFEKVEKNSGNGIKHGMKMIYLQFFSKYLEKEVPEKSQLEAGKRLIYGDEDRVDVQGKSVNQTQQWFVLAQDEIIDYIATSCSLDEKEIGKNLEKIKKGMENLRKYSGCLLLNFFIFDRKRIKDYLVLMSDEICVLLGETKELKKNDQLKKLLSLLQEMVGGLRILLGNSKNSLLWEEINSERKLTIEEMERYYEEKKKEIRIGTIDFENLGKLLTVGIYGKEKDEKKGKEKDDDKNVIKKILQFGPQILNDPKMSIFNYLEQTQYLKFFAIPLEFMKFFSTFLRELNDIAKANIRDPGKALQKLGDYLRKISKEMKPVFLKHPFEAFLDNILFGLTEIRDGMSKKVSKVTDDYMMIDILDAEIVWTEILRKYWKGIGEYVKCLLQIVEGRLKVEKGKDEKEKWDLERNYRQSFGDLLNFEKDFRDEIAQAIDQIEERIENSSNDIKFSLKELVYAIKKMFVDSRQLNFMCKILKKKGSYSKKDFLNLLERNKDSLKLLRRKENADSSSRVNENGKYNQSRIEGWIELYFNAKKSKESIAKISLSIDIKDFQSTVRAQAPYAPCGDYFIFIPIRKDYNDK
ncbi:MAG: hypothetical protein LBI77_04215 [Puniceicoccales bacterium]|nr:hypothetical protein [Puniceicoccales bacterium]